MKCPVCDNVNESMVCVRCGFDSSRDYTKYPTFGPVGRVPAPVKETRRRMPWFTLVACTVTLILGIAIGTGLGGGTVIGRDSVIGANAFITHSIPEATTVSIKSQELQFKQRKCAECPTPCENWNDKIQR